VGTDHDKRTLVLAAADPAQAYGAALPWPKREALERRPARVAGAYVVSVDERPVLYVERGGRGLVLLGELAAGAEPSTTGGEADIVHHALRALADAVRSGRVPKLSLERIDGEPAIGSPLASALVELGFQPGPRRLTLSA
jgi:ATP-dependent Lhr-like helicase